MQSESWQTLNTLSADYLTRQSFYKSTFFIKTRSRFHYSSVMFRVIDTSEHISRSFTRNGK